MGPPDPGLRIRRAVRGDVEDLRALLTAAFEPWASEYTEPAFAATVPSASVLADRLAEGPVWVATQRLGRGGPRARIVGTVGAVRTHEALYLRSLAVAPEAQGRGVGGALIDRAEAQARALGVRSLRLSTTPFLQPALRLYRRHGFRTTKAGPHDLEGTPLVTMEKLLIS